MRSLHLVSLLALVSALAITTQGCMCITLLNSNVGAGRDRAAPRSGGSGHRSRPVMVEPRALLAAARSPSPVSRGHLYHFLIEYGPDSVERVDLIWPGSPQQYAQLAGTDELPEGAEEVPVGDAAPEGSLQVRMREDPFAGRARPRWVLEIWDTEFEVYDQIGQVPPRRKILTAPPGSRPRREAPREENVRGKMTAVKVVLMPFAFIADMVVLPWSIFYFIVYKSLESGRVGSAH